MPTGLRGIGRRTHLPGAIALLGFRRRPTPINCGDPVDAKSGCRTELSYKTSLGSIADPVMATAVEDIIAVGACSGKQRMTKTIIRL